MTIRKAERTNLSLEDAERSFDEAITLPGGVAQMSEQPDGRWAVQLVWDDEGSTLERDAFDAFEKAEPRRTRGFDPKLGALSARFESNGNPGSIGHDSTGGFSYGAYQIATKTGTMAEFLKFLEKNAPAIAARLDAAGGARGASAGTPEFKAAWRDLGKSDPAFADAQHAFIQSTHYDPCCARIRKNLGLDVEARSPALRNVVWSVAVQHGPANKIFDNALAGKDCAQLQDASIIDAVYGERSKVERYFARSTPQVKAALVARFAEERRLAERMLG
ncbi:hypothetical protein [Piscinibacter koreensis]|uniref:Type VI secretion system spike protein VgrG3-like C-terminal domain-containing protein n=1 Tax=Piscinibacter koreensis TaxID=2742824 RepID=A0A7Y6NJL6_9BURK|nr:hypothetical protein [Schlegelella koreensis]NUZ04388.1 hypothetical protein [Schlegelella koreensis]